MSKGEKSKRAKRLEEIITQMEYYTIQITINSAALKIFEEKYADAETKLYNELDKVR